MIDVETLSILELRILAEKMEGLLFEHPTLTGLKDLHKKVKDKLCGDPRYQKGLALLAEAEVNSGIVDGYCRPHDYYFCVVHQDIVEPVYDKHKITGYRPTGEKDTVLLLCFKWTWWMNGESYVHRRDNHAVRNFDSFLTGDTKESWYEDDTGSLDPNVLRQQLITAGLEELPALGEFYEKECRQSHEAHMRLFSENEL